MAATVSAIGTAKNSSATPVTDTSLTVNAGDTALLLLIANFTENADSGTPTWGGTNLTFIDGEIGADGISRTAMWGLVNPQSGVQTLSIPNTLADNITICTMSFKGTGTTKATAFGTTQKANGNNPPATVTITTANTYDLIVAQIVSKVTGQVLSGLPGQIYNTAIASGASAASNSAGGTNIAMSVTLGTSGVWAILALDMLAAPVVTSMLAQQCQ